MQLNTREQRMIVAALTVRTPSGGGSTVNTLAMKLADEWGIERYDDRQMNLMRTLSDTAVAEATGS